MSGPAVEVLVVGSLNRDQVCRVDRLPAPGETVLGGEASVGSGGKGANQAAAAGLLGARTAMVGCVGADDDGRALLADLESAGVDTRPVVTVAGVRTGTAFVLVGPDGENSIVVAPGANGRVDSGVVRDSVRRLLGASGVLVTQAEIPEAAVDAAVRAAAAVGARAVVNLAPYRPVAEELLALCDPLVVNESEAGALLGRSVHGTEDALRAAQDLAARTRSVVVTVGAQGAVLAAGERLLHVPAEAAVVVDTTGAGDAFVGALAAALSAGSDLLAAVAAGVRAGTYAVARPGAQASYPTRAALGTGLLQHEG